MDSIVTVTNDELLLSKKQCDPHTPKGNNNWIVKFRKNFLYIFPFKILNLVDLDLLTI